MLSMYADEHAETSTSPHEFVPLKKWDITGRGRCRHCYRPKRLHPVRAWVAARSIGDHANRHKSYAR